MTRSKRQAVSVKAAIDYLTITTKSGKQTAEMLSAAVAEIAPLVARGIKLREWQFMGYHGKSINGMRYGVRGDEGIVIVSGDSAGELWLKLAPSRSRCTRIDLAVTVELAKANQYVASKAYGNALELGQAKASHIVNSTRGTTTYVGSRTSRFFGRLYDKGAESGEESGIKWRYEVECKKPASEAIVSSLLEQKEPAMWISSYVWDWFNTRGIRPIYDTRITHNAIEISASVQSVDKTLDWLTTQVRPAIGRLIIGGYEDEVREALQLPLIIKDSSRTDTLGGVVWQ